MQSARIASECYSKRISQDKNITHKEHHQEGALGTLNKRGLEVFGSVIKAMRTKWSHGKSTRRETKYEYVNHAHEGAATKSRETTGNRIAGTLAMFAIINLALFVIYSIADQGSDTQ